MYKYGYGWADEITVYPAASGGDHPYGSTTSVQLWAGSDYVDNDGDYGVGVFDDWGVIEVDDPIGNDTGWLGLVAANSIDDVAGLQYQTNGYPADLDNAYVSNYSDKWMYTTYGRILRDKSKFLPTVYADIDFFGGQSGSAMYRDYNNYGYSAQAIGVAGDSQTILVLINDWLFDFFIDISGR